MVSGLANLAQKMQQDLEWYFENAYADSGQNVLMFKKQMDIYQLSIIPMGFAQIAINLRNFPGDKRTQFEREGYANRMGELCVSYGQLWIAAWADIVASFGMEGVDRLIEVFQIYNEDVGALAAIATTSDTLKDKKPPYLEQTFLKALNNSIGTGLKLGLAYALFSLGNKEPLAALANEYLVDPGEMDSHRAKLRYQHPYASSEDIEELLLIDIYKNAQVVNIIILDIASSGDIPKESIRHWVSPQKRQLL